jgi:signal transduction histidine kinase
LGWLGWQFLKQDRALEGQRAQERLEMAADHTAAALRQNLAELEDCMDFVPDSGDIEPPDGVIVLAVTEHSLDAYPPGRLLFYPVIPDGEEPPASTFAAGEALEFRRGDPAGAAEVFRKLSQSPFEGVRAGALLRLGRNLRKLGRNEEALKVYDELARLGAASVLGLPAELVAREARGTVLEETGNRQDLRAEALLLRSALWSGRWRLLRPAWEFHEEEARRWSGARDAPLTESERDGLALTIAAEMIHAQWLARPDSNGSRIFSVMDRPVLVSWSGSSDRLAGALAGPGYLRSNWKNVLEARGAQSALLDTDGTVLVGSYAKGVRHAIRTAAATGLPGTLYTTHADRGSDEAAFAGRRRLLLFGLAVLTLVLLAGSYFIMRSINRERAVARLQSEFVSAVSHEFRSPLTSLRQLSEMLSKGRVPTEELRQQSYDVLNRESERLQRLVESLLDFGRIEARGFRYRFERLDPAALIRDIAAEFREKVTDRGYRVELALGGESPPIRADREALGLALKNLLDNAVKYSPECRTVWVEMARERGRLAIRVRDRGMGIPGPEQKDIFEKFVRGSGSGAAGIRGTGVGLAMARRIVEAHDGEIRLESEPGRGSVFTILLPLEGTT